MTNDQLIELRSKMQQLTQGMEDRIVFNAETGRAVMLAEAGKMENAFDLEKAIPSLQKYFPNVTDDQIEDLMSLTHEVNTLMRQYIEDYGVFPPELGTH